MLNSALSAITAAVVGVILNLAVWFSLHTLFAKVETKVFLDQTRYFHGLKLLVPDPATLNFASLGIALLACLLTFYWKKGMAVTLAICAATGAVLYFAPKLFG